MKRKGQAGIYGLVGVILVFVVMGIVAALGMSVTEDVKTDLTANSAGYNATVDSELAVGKVTGKGTIIATTAVFAVLLTMIVGIVAAMRFR